MSFIGIGSPIPDIVNLPGQTGGEIEVTLDYPSASACNDASPFSPSEATPPGGTFAATPSGLNINASTGEVTPVGSTPQAYTISYTVSGVTSSFALTINAVQQSTFSYASSSFQNSGTALPTLAGGTTPGGTFTSSSPSDLPVNSSTGELDLSSSTVGGPYTITYTTPGPCATSSTFQVSITAAYASTSSFSFDGVNDIFNFQNEWFAPSTPSQSTGNTVGSFSLWAKLPSNVSSGGLMGMVSINVGSSSKPLIWLMFNRSASSTGRYIRAYVSGANSTQTGVLQSQQFFIYDNSSTTYPNSGISFTADTWYHIAVVHDKNATNRYKAYINGNEFLIPNTTGTGSNGERTIGEMPYSLPYNPTSAGISPNVDLGFSRTSASGGTQYFDGNLDEVSFWNTALSSDAITEIYNSGAPNDLTSLTNASSSNLLAWYKMGE
jgi:hypothetical protein